MSADDTAPRPKFPCKYFIGDASAVECLRCEFSQVDHWKGPHRELEHRPDPPAPPAVDQATTDLFEPAFEPLPADPYLWELDSAEEDAREAAAAAVKAEPEPAAQAEPAPEPTQAEPERQRAAPLVVTAAEFLAENDDERFMSLWGDALLTEGGGYTIVSGEGGIGKTIVLVGLFISLAAGLKEFLGFTLPGDPVPVLVFQAEGSRRKFRARMRTAAAGYGLDLAKLPIFFRDRTVEPNLTEEGLGRMIQESGARAVRDLADHVGDTGLFAELVEPGEGKAAVGSQEDLRPGELFPHPLDDPAQNRDRAPAVVSVAGPQDRRHRPSLLVENQQRQVLPLIVVAVEHGQLLGPVNRIGRRVKVQHDPSPGLAAPSSQPFKIELQNDPRQRHHVAPTDRTLQPRKRPGAFGRG